MKRILSAAFAWRWSPSWERGRPWRSKRRTTPWVIKDGTFEIRDYAPHVVAETLVEGTLEEAGNKAFDRLFRYISGGNRMREKVAMTAPVSQQPKGEKIPMTAPVAQQRVQERWAVSFTMPASTTPETLPAPEDPQVDAAPDPCAQDGCRALLRVLERTGLPAT